jgi:hypothetical protein
MARQYHGEIRNHLDKNFPYLVVIFDGVGNVPPEQVKPYAVNRRNFKHEQ